jgi:hypothetical protein
VTWLLWVIPWPCAPCPLKCTDPSQIPVFLSIGPLLVPSCLVSSLRLVWSLGVPPVHNENQAHYHRHFLHFECHTGCVSFIWNAWKDQKWFRFQIFIWEYLHTYSEISRGQGTSLNTKFLRQGFPIKSRLGLNLRSFCFSFPSSIELQVPVTMPGNFYIFKVLYKRKKWRCICNREYVVHESKIHTTFPLREKDCGPCSGDG